MLIAGPTASGKSALALALAEKLGGVVVNTDSMQVYRDLAVITARPASGERRGCRTGSMATSMLPRTIRSGAGSTDAQAMLGEAAREGRLPILVGGTGLYFKALTQGLCAVPPIPGDIRAAASKARR